MTLHAGHCSTCDALIWRTVTHGRTGVESITYPKPDSLYARVAHPSGGVAVGIGFCAEHAPVKGVDDVVDVETAGGRYANWFTLAFGAHLRAWFQDHCELPEHEVSRLMDQWMDDRKAVEGAHVHG